MVTRVEYAVCMNSGLWFVVLGLVALLAAWALLTFNKLIMLRNERKQAWSGIDVQLKRRADLIPRLVDTVQGYVEHERGVLESVTKARSKATQATDMTQAAEADGDVTSSVATLFAVAERYPDLKASEQFLQLQSEISETEDRIASARRMHNAIVQRYNTVQQQFPASIVAGICGFTTEAFYRIEDDAERSVPAV
jgi:LemA protein